MLDRAHADRAVWLVARVAYLRDEELNTQVLVLEDEGSIDRIEIQRALTFDSQDVAQGMDTYCLVRGGAAHYGGIVRWVVHSNELALELDDAVASTLDLPIALSIPIDDPGAELLRQHLSRLCRVPRS